MLNHRPLLIAGTPVWNHPYPVRSPWDGRTVTLVSRAGSEEAESAAVGATRAFDEMRHMPAHRRACILRSAADGVRAQAEVFVEILRDEGGKPVRLGRDEVERAARTLEACAAEACRVDAGVLSTCADPWAPMLVKRSFPRGPVLALVPFAFPLEAACRRVGPAIAAGCPIVVRPSQQTPSAALLLGEILLSAGLPGRAISVIPADRAITDALSTHPSFATLAYGGAERGAWTVHTNPGRKHVVLDHGVDTNAIVEEDADIDSAVAEIGRGAFAHAGQGCASMQRVLVNASVFDAVVSRFAEEIRRVPHGDPSDPEVLCGPMIDARRRGQVESWMQDAEMLGARRIGGGQRSGSVLTPALFVAPGPAWKLWGIQASGPVAVLEPYATLDEAIDRINTGPFAQETGLFTNDLPKLWRAFDRLEAGSLVHDEYPTPHGERTLDGDRGGRSRHRATIDELTEVRTLMVRPRPVEALRAG
jgi:acyl-CoA reductase-like NAD-dependent aldehyde dehydrogenase